MYLYLLRFQEGDRFKIGIATNLSQRIAALGKSNFDLSNSFYVSGTPLAIKKLERQLHSDFAPANLPHDALSSGNTEIFDITRWDEVLEEIRYKAKKFPHLKLELHESILFSTPAVKSSDDKIIKPLIRRVQITGLREFVDLLCHYAESIKMYYDVQGHLDTIGVISQASQLKKLPYPALEFFSQSKRTGRVSANYTANIVSHIVSQNDDKGVQDIEITLTDRATRDRQVNRLKSYISTSILKHAEGKVEIVSEPQTSNRRREEKFRHNRGADAFKKERSQIQRWSKRLDNIGKSR